MNEKEFRGYLNKKGSRKTFKNDSGIVLSRSSSSLLSEIVFVCLSKTNEGYVNHRNPVMPRHLTRWPFLNLVYLVLSFIHLLSLSYLTIIYLPDSSAS